MSISLATRGVLRELRRLARTIDRVESMTAELLDYNTVTGLLSNQSNVVGIVDIPSGTQVQGSIINTMLVGILDEEDDYQGSVS